MPSLSNPLGFRRWAAGVCLIVAPLLYIAGAIVDPALRQGGDTTGVYGRYPEQVSVSASLLHWSWVLMIPGIIGMIHLIRHRGVVFGHLAGGLALLGVVNFSGLMLVDFFYSRLERALGGRQGEMLAEQALSDPGATFGFQIPGFLGLLGLFLLGLALAYAGHGPWWAPFAIIAGVFGTLIFPIGTAVGGLLYLAGSGVIGLRMLRMSDAEWAGREAAQPVAAEMSSGNRAATR
ncbi:hypothetical protein OG884_27655 [Streptosporangium sp. NBC_01755]|uniref:hypothetical protein n=1 Tax=unclassified Streptosporangium TaxID=2632669 RepID=UPI002DDADBF1|nr:MULTISPECIES: hypothetical protein [unclassified Streptosporangium]WSA23244.1 hypothetical protein OIE13_19950 [Streptosporangium sp. NBC_01810]WSC98618.1 hypothetical protein OG884_27655 [Streptosporangium sp. NBC_01755]